MKARDVVDHPKLTKAALMLVADADLRELAAHLPALIERADRTVAVARRERAATRRELQRRGLTKRGPK